LFRLWAISKFPLAENLPPPALRNLKGDSLFEVVADIAVLAGNGHCARGVNIFFDASRVPAFSAVGLKLTY